jgi:hypothetical protein
MSLVVINITVFVSEKWVLLRYWPQCWLKSFFLVFAWGLGVVMGRDDCGEGKRESVEGRNSVCAIITSL